MIRQIIALLPFGYIAVTRIRYLRDFLYLLLTQLLPSAYLAVRLGDVAGNYYLLSFVAGYFAFLSIYELGYLLNDSWDASSSDDGRNRIPFNVNAWFVACFVIIRGTTWISISEFWDRLGDEFWLTLTVCLISTFLMHNLVKENSLRLASFAQLTIMRFTMPIIFAIGSIHFLTIASIAFMFYLHFRSLAYLDSKNLLAMPVRKMSFFGITQIALFAPLVFALSIADDSLIYFELWIYYLVVYATWFFVSPLNRIENA